MKITHATPGPKRDTGDTGAAALRRYAACGLALAALLPALASAYGTCNAYLNADGTVQAVRGEGDCWIGWPSRIATGVYTVGVSYPITDGTDPATGAPIRTLQPGICTISAGSDHAGAASVKMIPDFKPTMSPQPVPSTHNGRVTYTVRTFAAGPGPTLVPADLDFSMLCIN